MESIQRYHFFKEKYGKELLVDLVAISDINKYIEVAPTHRLTYYDIAFITEGREKISLNQNRLSVQPGDVICSIPGEVWSWPRQTAIQGYALLFEEEFLLSFFNDKGLLKKIKYLQNDRSFAVLRPGEQLFSKILDCLNQVETEIQLGIDSNEHVLRALVYLILGLLERAKEVRIETNVDSITEQSTNRYLSAFIKLVDEHYLYEHEVQFYADKLSITPNYLNRITKEVLGFTSKKYILTKIIQEAKNLLSYTSLSVAQISDELKFDAPSYFVRLFRKYVGMTPKQFRDQR
ncbi:AraC family transcriptional regulator [Spirosoma sp. KNUC1025]|uniref:helix-turn-helix domain-containing protein n=1 Tax=Spirosoma sp. KNUC1025 TaxID=2894082 RepID=UPI001E581F43|nr:AraC family transcriptional regulator [Spirosoma sp. KNUC1025]UFH57744.1 AraC family transcriptional regulator [Spirosoma sp. KNUC1025]